MEYATVGHFLDSPFLSPSLCFLFVARVRHLSHRMLLELCCAFLSSTSSSSTSSRQRPRIRLRCRPLLPLCVRLSTHSAAGGRLHMLACGTGPGRRVRCRIALLDGLVACGLHHFGRKTQPLCNTTRRCAVAHACRRSLRHRLLRLRLPLAASSNRLLPCRAAPRCSVRSPRCCAVHISRHLLKPLSENALTLRPVRISWSRLQSFPPAGVC